MIDTLNFHNKIDINVNSLIPMPTVQQQRIVFSPKMCGFQKNNTKKTWNFERSNLVDSNAWSRISLPISSKQ